MQYVEGIKELQARAEILPGVALAAVLAQLCGAWVQQPKNDTKNCAVSTWLPSLTAAMDTERWYGLVTQADRWAMARMYLCMTSGSVIHLPPLLRLPETLLEALPHQSKDKVFGANHDLGILHPYFRPHL